MSALPPKNLVITGKSFNETDSTFSITATFNLSISLYTACEYNFDLFVGDELFKSLTVSTNDYRNSFLVTGLALETTYRILGQTYCESLNPRQSDRVELITFTTPSCLEYTNFNLNICPPPAVSNVVAKLEPPSPQSSNETSLFLEWKPPIVPVNASGSPVEYEYKVEWHNNFVFDRPLNEIRRSEGQKIFNSTKATVSGLLSGYNYTVSLSSSVANGKSGWSNKTILHVPAATRACTPSTGPIRCPLPPPPPIERESTPTVPRSLTKDLQNPTNLVAMGVGIIVVALLLGLSAFLVRRGLKSRKRRNFLTSPTSLIGVPNDKMIDRRPSTVDNPGYITIPEGRPHGIQDIAQIHLRWPYQGTIPITAMRTNGKIAEGAFGVVNFAYLSIPNVPRLVEVAVKTVRGEGCQEEISALLSEIELMRQIPSHQSVIRMIGHCISTRFMETCLLMEYCANGDLRSYVLRCRVDLTPNLLLDFSVQIAEGMEHLARHNIVHRDLAARNVLITGDQRVKITDFGLSRAVPLYYRKTTPGKVPWKWLAPESLTPLESCYSSKSDVWSFGVVLHEIFSWGKTPWPHLSRADQLERLLHPQYGNNRMPKPMGCSNEVYAVMQKCWQYMPEDRPNFDELVRQLRGIVLTEPEGAEYVCFDVPPHQACNSGDSAMGRSRSEASLELEENIIEINEMVNLY